MAFLSNLDTSSELEYDSSQDSTSEIDKDSNNKTPKPEHNAEDFENALWDPTTQLHTA